MLGTDIDDTIEVFETGFLENARVLVVLGCVSRWSTGMIEWNANFGKHTYFEVVIVER